MRRREFIVGLGAAAWPAVALGQLRAIPVIGLLSPNPLKMTTRTGPFRFSRA